MKYKYFSDHEVKGLNIQFVMLLDSARDQARCPFIITSGFRTKEENKAVGGVENSAHTRGLAVDLKVVDSNMRFKITRALIDAGMNRIGHYLNHIHVDIDATLPQNVMWLIEKD